MINAITISEIESTLQPLKIKIRLGSNIEKFMISVSGFHNVMTMM